MPVGCGHIPRIDLELEFVPGEDNEGRSSRRAGDSSQRRFGWGSGLLGLVRICRCMRGKCTGPVDRPPGGPDDFSQGRSLDWRTACSCMEWVHALAQQIAPPELGHSGQC